MPGSGIQRVPPELSFHFSAQVSFVWPLAQAGLLSAAAKMNREAPGLHFFPVIDPRDSADWPGPDHVPIHEPITEPGGRSALIGQSLALWGPWKSGGGVVGAC